MVRNCRIMNIIYDTHPIINENINLRLNGLRLRSEASEGLKNLNGKWIQICMRGFRPFSGSPGLRAGSGAADFLHVRHPIPQSRFASVGECKPRSRPGRVVGESGWGGGVPVYRACRGRRLARGRAGCWRIRVGRRCPGLPKTRGACLPDKAGVCLSGSREAIGCRYGCRPARKRRCGRMPGPPSAGCPACREMRGPVTRTAPSVCRKGVLVVGTGALPCLLPAKNEGSPERLPSPSKINP